MQTFFRTTTTETELGGAALPAGAKILLFLGAANPTHPRRWRRRTVGAAADAGSVEARGPRARISALVSSSASLS